ncbi:Dyp-type peroxidase domain-containing protein [Brasilonema sp. UFV-L1]|uniref:Dyp-type peroxidase domain-containing protein n=1 Tax=Brasilonema sp. UFV-L1 TaxID=2234130 RepID=UPI00145F0C96|nr:peroxidase [Brasilonema sp. UFV-L1]
MAGKLQEGIYHSPGVKPGNFFNILFLRTLPGLDARQVGEAFGKLWQMYQELKNGKLTDLPEHPLPAGDLTVLVGYGANVFKLPGIQRQVPSQIREFGAFRSPLPTGGGPLLIGSGLRYADDVKTNPATEEIAVQFIAETQLAVNRAVVETWKALQNMSDLATGAAPLLLTGFYSGFQRDDGRSWIDFHDGISNMKSSERSGAIAIKPRPPEERWIEGGTYLVFLRIAIELTVWQKLNRQQQELLVGRDKITGCPLMSLDSEGHPVIKTGCPVTGRTDVLSPGNEAFFEPETVNETILKQSHVQRANHHLTPVSDRTSLRIFRQGYDFLEPLDSAPGFRTGLNFVSFQDTPERLLRMLTQETWLGSTNFGGDPKNQLTDMDRFLSIRAAAIFLVPPVVEGELFPGAGIFM